MNDFLMIPFISIGTLRSPFPDPAGISIQHAGAKAVR